MLAGEEAIDTSQGSLDFPPKSFGGIDVSISCLIRNLPISMNYSVIDERSLEVK